MALGFAVRRVYCCSKFQQTTLPGPLPTFTSHLSGSIFYALIGPLFYIFFSQFPEKSPLERRVPWLKWVALASTAFQIIQVCLLATPAWLRFVGDLIGDAGVRARYSSAFLFLVSSRCFGIAIASKPLPRRGASPASFLQVRCSACSRLFSSTSSLIFPATVRVSGLSLFELILVLLYPLSFAYAVVKHRVLEIPGAPPPECALRTRAAWLLSSSFLRGVAGHLSVHAIVFRLLCR